MAVLNDIGTTIRIGATRNSAATSARIEGTIAACASAPEPIETGEAVVEADDEAGGGQQHYGDGRRESPREELLDLLIDELGDHHVTRRSEQHRRHEEAETRHEHQETTVDHAGQAERQEHFAERRDRPRAETRRG